MTVDYLDKVNGFGDCIMRLFDFDSLQADKFRKIIQQTIIQNKKSLDLATVDFVTGVNCNLIFRVSDEDLGITSANNKLFFCDLTIDAYAQMINLIAPFCGKQSSRGHAFLYDVDTETDLLFSPMGTWDLEIERKS